MINGIVFLFYGLMGIGGGIPIGIILGAKLYNKSLTKSDNTHIKKTKHKFWGALIGLILTPILFILVFYLINRGSEIDTIIFYFIIIIGIILGGILGAEIANNLHKNQK